MSERGPDWSDRAAAQLCSSCGVVRLPGSTVCSRCKGEQRDLAEPARRDRTAWSCVECTFQCRSCAFRVPLNAIDDVVVCAHCGLEQALDIGQWGAILAGAHATADLWGERGAGLSVPELAEVGRSRTSFVVDGDGVNQLKATASPGHPVCTTCRALLDVRVDRSDKTHFRAVSTCTGCGATATFDAPEALHTLSSATAILATEHRADRQRVRVDPSTEALAVHCPQCNAPLPVDDATKFVTCAYCKMQSRIPDKTWFKIAKTIPAPEPMWLLFQGPSRLRQELLSRQKDAERKKEEAAHLAEREGRERERRRQQAQKQLDADRARKEAEETRLAGKRAKEAKEEKEAQTVAVVIGVILAVLFGGTALGTWYFNRPTELDQVMKQCDEEGDAKACVREGALLASSKPEDAEKAFKRACELNDLDGCLRAGQSEERHRAFDRAISDYETACDHGLIEACAAGHTLAASPSAPLDVRVAFYKRDCNMMKLDGCNSAGDLYAAPPGPGAARDLATAASFYRRACSGSNTAGCQHLTELCKEGFKDACAAPTAGANKRK